MKFRIKSRTYDCGKKLKDILFALREDYSMKVIASELSNAMNGIDVGPKAQIILSNANEVVTKWENERKLKNGNNKNV